MTDIGRDRRYGWVGVAISCANGLLLMGCVSTQLAPEARSTLDRRPSLDVSVGRPMRLFDHPPDRVAGLRSHDGRVHVFAIDSEKVLQHVEVDGDSITVREQVGKAAEGSEPIMLDAVEWPSGTLRVVYGPVQFVRSRGDGTWRKIERNRCVRFVVARQRLYCGFVMSGKEFGSQERTDVYWGLVMIFPLAIPVQRQSEKLVIAEAVDESWTVRAVLDVEDPLDAQPYFLMDVDNDEFVHVLYAVNRGGGWFVIGPGLAGGGPEGSLRYARVKSSMLDKSSDGTSKRSAEPVILLSSDAVSDSRLGMLYFVVNPAFGRLEGLVTGVHHHHALWGAELVFDELRVDSSRPVLRDDWPREGMRYTYFNVMVAADADGTLHALVPSCGGKGPFGCEPGFNYLSYLRRRDGEWSHPIELATKSPAHVRKPYALMIADGERVYVAWGEEGAEFSGRWITHRVMPRH